MGHLRTVTDLLDIKHLTAEGLNTSQIARRLGMHRDTVAKYRKLTEIPVQVERAKVARKIDAYVNHIEMRLDQYPELTAERLFREIRKRGYTGSRRSVRRYVAQVRPFKLRVYRPIETLPGEQAQVDWGHFGTFTEDGQTFKLYAFVMVLSWSRMRYVEFTTSQDTATFLACHRRALAYFGGVPHEILYDNAKTVVQERVGWVIRFHLDLLRFAAAYGFKPQACWMEDPESKGKVENAISYLRRDFYYGTEFPSLSELQRQVRTWMDEVANAQVSEATDAVPAEAVKEERPFLLPLPAHAIAIAMEGSARISKTCLLKWGGNTYSVPDELARRKVTLYIYEDRLDVRWEGKTVITLPRLRGKGQHRILPEHYQHRQRGPGAKGDILQRRFEAIGPAAPAYLIGLSHARQRHLREQAQGILDLCPVYGAGVVHAAMERAASFGAYGYGTIKRILAKQQRAPEALPEHPAPRLPVTVGVPAIAVQQRSPSYYQQALGQRP